jgi:hypothetical protein
MNLKSLITGAAIAATVVGGSVAASAPAQAATLTPPGGFTLDIKTSATNITQTQFKLNFTSVSVLNSSGGFSGITGTSIPSLTLNKTGTTMLAAIPGFISGLTLGGDVVTFNLLGGELNSFFTNATNYSVGGTFFGNLVSDNSVSAIGSLSSTVLSSFNSGTASVAATAVPTPALLPGLLGLGVAALRKRKGEGAEKEAVGVKA